MDERTGTVISEQRGSALLLTLSYPARRNAVSVAMRAELESALQQAQRDDRCRVVVLTGEGENFCSGGDVSSFAGVTSSAGRDRMRDLHPLIRLLAAGKKPVVAAVEGAAIGAGLGLAAACDVVVCGDSARLAAPYSRFGLVPDYGAMWALPDRIGVARTKMLVMSGATLNAVEAERIGLIDTVVPAGTAVTEALQLADQISKGAPLAHQMLKAVLVAGHASLDALLAAEADAQAVLYGTEDYVEGYTSFLERREPTFRGR